MVWLDRVPLIVIARVWISKLFALSDMKIVTREGSVSHKSKDELSLKFLLSACTRSLGGGEGTPENLDRGVPRRFLNPNPI